MGQEYLKSIILCTLLYRVKGLRNKRRAGRAPKTKYLVRLGDAFRDELRHLECPVPRTPPPSPMIDRYSRPAMRALWSEQAQFQPWLDDQRPGASKRSAREAAESDEIPHGRSR